MNNFFPRSRAACLLTQVGRWIGVDNPHHPECRQRTRIHGGEFQDISGRYATHSTQALIYAYSP